LVSISTLDCDGENGWEPGRRDNIGMTDGVAVGIIANPASARDIRRLVTSAGGTVVAGSPSLSARPLGSVRVTGLA